MLRACYWLVFHNSMYLRRTVSPIDCYLWWTKAKYMGYIHLLPSSGGYWVKKEMQAQGLYNGEDEYLWAPDDRGIQYGFIPGERTEEEKKKWFEKVYEEDREAIESYMTRQFSADDKLVVWHGKSSAGLLELYMACNLIPCRIFEVDYSKVFKENEQDYITNVNAGEIAACFKAVRELSAEEVSNYAEQWNKAYYDNTHSSFLKDGFRFINRETRTIESEANDYLDELVMSVAKRYCKESPIHLNVLCGRCLAQISVLETIDFDAIVETVERLSNKGVLKLFRCWKIGPTVRNLTTVWGRIRAHLPARRWYVMLAKDLEWLDETWLDSKNPWESYRERPYYPF